MRHWTFLAARIMMNSSATVSISLRTLAVFEPVSDQNQHVESQHCLSEHQRISLLILNLFMKPAAVQRSPVGSRGIVGRTPQLRLTLCYCAGCSAVTAETLRLYRSLFRKSGTLTPVRMSGI